MATISSAGDRPVPFPVSQPRAAQVLDVLTLLVSVRRSLFTTDNERRRFLLQVMGGISDIMRAKMVRSWITYCTLDAGLLAVVGFERVAGSAAC